MELALAASLAGLAALAFGCAPCAKMDGWNVFSRDTLSRPQRTLDAIPVTPGARVADLGAGRGYFAWRLAEAVGPEGRVYAVEVEDGLVRKLRRGAAERGLANVEVVRGSYEDPGLPDGAIDVVLLSSVYHHVADRVAYMKRLRADLAPGAHVAILEPRPTWESWLLLLPPGHGVAPDVIESEMRAAGYRRTATHEFLAAHSFQVFRADAP
jgi:ubiquinone/menaquinone biosynthesis C-methylase UbiE